MKIEHELLRCPHCSGKLTSFVRRDDELDRVREATIRDARVIALENQLAGAVEEHRVLSRALRLACAGYRDKYEAQDALIKRAGEQLDAERQAA